MKEYLLKKLVRAQGIKDRATTKIKGFADNKGESHLVAVIGVIIVVIVILAVIFQPQISAYIKDTVMPGLKTTTDKLLKYAG